ncbi:MAG: hypothetical protein HY020_23355 [Burkholderiales bacterium]|nr:hypothetical protein [Burkholderiales bacterium]
MPLSLVDRLGSFANPHDEAQLRELDETVGLVQVDACGEAEIRAMLSVFERLPDEDGYGVFWSILHCLEKCPGYEPLLVESALRAPVEFNLSMVNRLLNSGITEVSGQSLLGVLQSAAASSEASGSTKEFARNFIEHQRGRNHAET